MYSLRLKCALISVVCSAVMCAALLSAADNDKTTFQAKPVSEYPHRQTSEKVTIAASPFMTDEQTKEPFGKLNPWRLGVLPVLVVIQNDGKDAIRTDKLKFVYVLPDNVHIEATPPGDVKYLEGARRPSTVRGPPAAFTCRKARARRGSGKSRAGHFRQRSYRRGNRPAVLCIFRRRMRAMRRRFIYLGSGECGVGQTSCIILKFRFL